MMGRGIICAYNVNLDAVCRVDCAELSRAVNELGIAGEVLEKVRSPPGAIYEISDFFAGLVHCMEQGKGEEWFVFDRETYDFLGRMLGSKVQLRMGGNAGNMANALAKIDPAALIVPNVPMLSGGQAGLFSRGNIRIPVRKGDSLCLSAPKNAAGKGDEAATHFILEFVAGDRLRIGDVEIEAPREDRFIATWDRWDVEVEPAFKEYTEENALEFQGALVSGFHLLLPRYADGSTFRDRLTPSIEHLKNLRSRNEGLYIHLELAHFQSPLIMHHVVDALSGIVASIGANGVELAALLGTGGVMDKVEEVVRGAIGFMEGRGLERLCVHTRNFVISLWRDPRLSPEKELEALKFGVSASAVLAESGEIGGGKRIEEAASRLSPDPGVLDDINAVASELRLSRRDKGAYGSVEGLQLCIVPALLCARPKRTVGLGDCFTAATFYKELEGLS